jgi:hypothetical protein
MLGHEALAVMTAGLGRVASPWRKVPTPTLPQDLSGDADCLVSQITGATVADPDHGVPSFGGQAPYEP